MCLYGNGRAAAARVRFANATPWCFSRRRPTRSYDALAQQVKRCGWFSNSNGCPPLLARRRDQAEQVFGFESAGAGHVPTVDSSNATGNSSERDESLAIFILECRTQVRARFGAPAGALVLLGGPLPLHTGAIFYYYPKV